MADGETETGVGNGQAASGEAGKRRVEIPRGCRLRDAGKKEHIAAKDRE